jgi:dTDP-4-dehydrorhamnose 3,5-epimerase
VQDNHSKSFRGVLRGLHYQLNPKAQGKLVRVLKGEVFDVAVDIRRSSLTFGKWVGAVLSCDNQKQIWIPEGFAHGFLTLSETSELLYKTTEFYDVKLERSILWNDTFLNITWPNKDPILSLKDLNGREFGMLMAMAFLVLFMGLWPAPFTDRMTASVDDLLSHVAVSKIPAGTTP